MLGIITRLFSKFTKKKQNSLPIDPTAITAQGEFFLYFSPLGGCTDAIVAEINEATKSIYVQAYSFTSQPISAALTDAKSRGLDVQVILDKNMSSEEGELGLTLKDILPVMLDPVHRIAHNKVMIIDEMTVLTGSFNFTYAAEHYNAENLLIVRNCQVLAARYKANWDFHKAHSEMVNK